MAPATAAVLRDEHDTVFLALVDSPRRTGRHTGWIEAMVADTRQIFHEQIMELQRDIAAHVPEIDILACRLPISQIVLPVRAPFYLHALLGDQRTRTGNRLMVLALGIYQRLIVIGPRLIIVVKLWLVGMIEQLGHARELGARAQAQLAILELPAALPFVLILPTLRIADARLGLDVVEIHVFRTFAVGPDVLAGDGARMAANALVKIHDHGNLGFNLQANLPPPSCALPHTCRAGCPSGRNN